MPTNTVDVYVPRNVLLTANQRLHWRVKAERTAALRNATARLAGKREPYPHRVRIVVDIAWPDGRRRDRSNLNPTIKSCVDGLVDAGWIADDDDKHIDGPDLRTSAARCSKDLACQLTFIFEEIA